MASATEIPFPSANPLASRTLSAIELFVGAFVVIGHNVFHALPNEVIILCVVGLLSLRLRDGGWSAMGLKRPAAYSSNRARSGCVADSPGSIRDRTCYWILLAETDRAGTCK